MLKRFFKGLNKNVHILNLSLIKDVQSENA